jgi:hypothetical protein
VIGLFNDHFYLQDSSGSIGSILAMGTLSLVAYLRTFTHIQLPKEIAEESSAERICQELAAESKESLVRFSPY